MSLEIYVIQSPVHHPPERRQDKKPDKPQFWIKFKHCLRSPWNLSLCSGSCTMGLGAAGVSLHIPHTLRFWAAQPEPAGCPCQEAPLGPLRCCLSQLRNDLCPCECRVPSAALRSRYWMQHKRWLKKQIPDVFLALECPESSCTALQTQPVSNVFNTIHSQLFLPLSAHSRKLFAFIQATPSAVRNGGLVVLPRKQILLFVHPSSTEERACTQHSSLPAGRPTYGVFSTWPPIRCPKNWPPEVRPPCPWLVLWQHIDNSRVIQCTHIPAAHLVLGM